MVPPTVGVAPSQLVIKIVLYRYACRQANLIQTKLQLRLPSQVIIGGVKFTVKAT